MARKCIDCESRKGMTRFKDETFVVKRAFRLALWFLW